MKTHGLVMVGVIGLAATAAARADISSGLLARLPLSTNAADVGPSHFNTIVHGGVSFAAGGPAAGFATFNGIDGWIELQQGGNCSIDLEDGDYTIAVWVRIDSPTTAGTIAQDRYESNVPVSYSFGYYPVSNGNFIANDSWWGTFGASPCTQVQAPLAPYIGEWHHLTTTYEHTSRVKKLYIDGMLIVPAVEMCPDEFPAPGPNNQTTTIGGYWGISMTNFFKGQMSDFRFYGRALSAADVHQFVCSGPVTFVEPFEPLSGSMIPPTWETRFPGGEQSVVTSPTFLGSGALKQTALSYGAAEIHTITSWKSTAGRASLDFALRSSSESTNLGTGCNDITVTYQGDHGAMECGFSAVEGGTGLVILGTNIPVQQDRWYQFHGVADYDKGTVTWYVDDVLITPCQSMSPGSTDPARTNRIEAHVGCIDAGQTIAYFDSIKFTPGTACKWDADGNGALNVADVFAYLNGWFSGCP